MSSDYATVLEDAADDLLDDREVALRPSEGHELHRHEPFGTRMVGEFDSAVVDFGDEGVDTEHLVVGGGHLVGWHLVEDVDVDVEFLPDTSDDAVLGGFAVERFSPGELPFACSGEGAASASCENHAFANDNSAGNVCSLHCLSRFMEIEKNKSVQPERLLEGSVVFAP